MEGGQLLRTLTGFSLVGFLCTTKPLSWCINSNYRNQIQENAGNCKHFLDVTVSHFCLLVLDLKAS